MKLEISRQEARHFLLKKQLLHPPQTLKGKQGIETVFETLRIIQYDPLNPCGRNPDLVLQSRVSDIHPDDYRDWLYTKRKGIECYDKELSIIPIEDFSLTHHAFAEVATRPRVIPFIQQYEKELEGLLQKIDKEGPLSSSDIADIRRSDVFWSEQQWGRVALETLWRTGRIVIVKRKNGRKYFDLPHKVYTKILPVKLNEAITSEHILRRVNSVGLLPKSGTGSGWLGVGNGKTIAPVIARLIEEKKLIEITINDVRQQYIMRADDIQKMKETNVLSEKRIVFIAPLDNLIWDRAMIKNFFGFEYTWEVYVPKAKRKFGYYVLPILYGDIFIGRIEPVLKDKNLIIKNIWKEENSSWDRQTNVAFNNALEQFRKYLNAKEIVIEKQI